MNSPKWYQNYKKQFIGLTMTEQDTPKMAEITGSDSDSIEYFHCSGCGTKIDDDANIVNDYIYCNKCYKKNND